MKHLRLLLVNPWISDFTAFDLWSKPLGLLYIAKFLRRYGYDVTLLDFMDRARWGSHSASKYQDGRGKYIKTVIEKPPLAKNFPRRYGIYGATPAQITATLQQTEKPKAILLTSLIAYWYPGVLASSRILRKYFPDIPLILGGIYTTLFTQHASQTIHPDYLLIGYGEKQVLQLLDNLFHIERDYSTIPPFDDSGVLPWDLYPKIDSATLLTSRGCPFRCSYCASHLLHPTFQQRQPEDVINEIVTVHERYGIKHFAFYDDALFARRDEHIVPILKGILKMNLQLNFHTPNGLFARSIDMRLAELLYATGFKTLRLSLESIFSPIQQASSNKVNNQVFIDAMQNLEAAGFKRNTIEVYLIMGLPGQTYDQVARSIDFVAEQGAITRLASFSPIPGTAAWQEALKNGLVRANSDPLITNATLFPYQANGLRYEDYLALRQYANRLNAQLRQGSVNQLEME